MAVKKRSTTKGKGSSRQKPSNRKKANPGRSGKRRKANDNSDKYGIVLLGVGILMLLSLLSKFNSSISMGSFGKFSYGVLTSFLGLGAFILPFIVLALGYMYIVSKGKIKYTSRFYGIIIVICSFLVLLNIFNFDTFYNPPNMMTAFEKIKESTSVFHGGILSFLITVPLCGIFGKTGGTLIVIIGFLIGGICITELDIESVIKVIRGYFGRRIEERRERNRDEVMPENEYAKNKGRQREHIAKEVAVSDNRSKFQKEADRVKIVDFLKSNTIHEPQERSDKTQQVRARNIEHQSPVEKNVDVPEKEKWSEQEIEIENSLFKEEKLPVDKEEEVKEEKPLIHMKEESKCIAKIGGEGESLVPPKTEAGVQNESEILKGCLESEVLKDDESSREKEIREYIFPSINLLKENREIVKSDTEKLKSEAEKLTNTLKSFGVKARVSKVTRGPSVTRFEIQPEVGVKVSKIVNLSDDIALNLAAASIRIEAPIPGKAAVGIEVPNRKLVPVLFKEIIESKSFQNSNGKLTTGLGKDISGKAVTADLSKMPHVLVAGATGSGKSVCINSLIISLLYKYSPEDVKLLMIDPKVVELNVYNGIPHLLIPVVTDPRKAAGALSWAVGEMERRYKAFADNGAKNIDSYNEMYDKGIIEEKMPYIVIIIDELADLMMVSPKDVEGYIARLAQMARAAGMHLVIATQRPSVDVITGMIKANIPSRIAFAVSSQVDSRTIIDSSGAEKLLGKGDMLFMPIGESKPKRIQGAFISEGEVEEIVNFIKIDKGQGEYHADLIDAIDSGSVSGGGDDGEADPLLSEAIELVLKQQKASTSMIQRKFKIGYNRAARIIEDMEERGIISGPNGSKPRTILLESMEEV